MSGLSRLAENYGIDLSSGLKWYNMNEEITYQWQWVSLQSNWNTEKAAEDRAWRMVLSLDQSGLKESQALDDQNS
jgi:hypothetical protein